MSDLESVLEHAVIAIGEREMRGADLLLSYDTEVEIARRYRRADRQIEAGRAESRRDHRA